MKKIILLIFCFIISFLILFQSKNVFAGQSCPQDNKGDWTDGCFCDKTDPPYGGCDDPWGSRDILCDATQDPAVCRGEKMENDPCNTDSDCLPTEETGGLECKNKHCKKKPVDTSIKEYAELGSACSSDSDCPTVEIYDPNNLEEQEAYCDLSTKKDNKGQCALAYSKLQGETCVGAKACMKSLDCYNGICEASQGSQTQGKNCIKDFACVSGTYCDEKTKECVSSKANGTLCEKDAECLGGSCQVEKDAEGNDKYIFAAGGQVLKKVCAQGRQENTACDENNKCAYSFVCENKICKKEIVIGDRQRFQLNNTEINLYCNADTKTGMFTAGVSKECWNCGDCKASDIFIVIANVINGSLRMVGLMAVFGIIISGFLYMISRGNPEKAEKAKAALTATITGLVIIFTAYLLINTVMTLLGYNCGQWFAPNFVC